MEREHTKRVLNEKLPLQQLQTLDSLIEVLIRPRQLKRDLFFALLLILMRENDFLQIKAPNEPAIDVPSYILSARKKNRDIYEATLILNHFQDSPIKLLASLLSDVMLLNVVILRTSETYATCLHVNRYVLTSNLRIPHSFANFEELSKIVKAFMSPVKSCVFNQYKSEQGSLLSIPEAIILRILLNLRVRDVLNLSESCKRMNCIVKEDLVWSRLYSRDFSDAHKYDGRGWLDMYKGIYVASRRREANNVQDPLEFSDRMRRAENPRWEIIL
ncbi:hypothetical protein MSG28_008462 [Choristoneura fumiferana]|uniref:Uncharacterized protein n=1 Tax=Choristoneura fumiferana TaxID=7141 RepID=A0ACC0J4S9_CHOFU|nr:hypothetical protein MSG28_008462 [Choristoneura fumiferana]